MACGRESRLGVYTRLTQAISGTNQLPDIRLMVLLCFWIAQGIALRFVSVATAFRSAVYIATGQGARTPLAPFA